MFSTTVLMLSLVATFVAGQGVTSAIAPEASPPASCVASYDGTFEITVAKVEGAVKRDTNTLAKRGDCATDGILVVTLENGVLKDAQARTGYIAANYQFQFDQPAQTGAIFTAGFSACGNGSLALGGSAVFYECASGDFFNLYDRSWAPQCSPVEILIMQCGGGNAGEGDDGQIVGTEVVTTTIVSALSDGQPQVRTTTTGVPLCQVSQIADGQVQVGTTPCASITTTLVATSTPVPVSQQSDGQIQVTPPASVPTVTNAPAPPEVTPSAPPASPPAASPPAESGSSAAAPSESQSASSETTLATTATGGGASGTTAAGTPATSAPATSGGARVQAASMGALFIGVIGAVAFL